MADYKEQTDRLEDTLESIAPHHKGRDLTKKFAVGGITAIMAATGLYAMGSSGQEGPQVMQDGELLVKFSQEMNVGVETDGNVVTGLAELDALNLELSGETYEQLVADSPEHELDQIFVVDVADSLNEFDLAESISEMAGVEYVELNYEMRLLPVEVGETLSSEEVANMMADKPNDTYFDSSGAWGQKFQDLYGLHIMNVPQAWETEKGSDDIIAAVVDTGVDYNHEDIKDRILRDEDGNVVGYDFINDDADPNDDQGHGTHVAGTIAATVNNGVGIAGVTWEGQIMPVKVLNARGSGSFESVAQGIVYSAQNGAHLINMSLGGRGQHQVVDEAIEFADSKGTIVITSAGNSNADAKGFTPANHPFTYAVASTNWEDAKSSYSNWGEIVDFATPGEQVLSLLAEESGWRTERGRVGDNYIVLSGTSMSSPHATGAAMILMSANNDLIGQREALREIMSTNVDDVDSPKPIGGRVNLETALQAAIEYNR